MTKEQDQEKLNKFVENVMLRKFPDMDIISAKQFIYKAYDARLFTGTNQRDLFNWFFKRFVPYSFELDEKDYLEATIQSLKIQFSIAGTDFGSSRQRDLGQKWSDTIRGYLGELGVKKLLKKKFKIDIKLGHELGTVKQYINSDIRKFKTPNDKNYRIPSINVSIKTTKANGVWLDIPGIQFSHSDVYILALTGLDVDHLFIYFKYISVFKDKILKKGVDENCITQAEADEIFNKIPSFKKIYGYLPGLIEKNLNLNQFQGKLGITQDYKYEGYLPKTKYTITNWTGKYDKNYLDAIKQTEGAKSIGFLGIDTFTKDEKYLFGLNSLQHHKNDWLNILINKL